MEHLEISEIPQKSQVQRFLELHRPRYERIIKKYSLLKYELYSFEDIASLVTDLFEKDPHKALFELERTLEFPFKSPIRAGDYLVLKGPSEEEIFGWGNEFYERRPSLSRTDSMVLSELLPINETVEIDAIPLIVSSRIKIREQVIERIKEQCDSKEIDLSMVDNYSSTQQAINYTITTQNKKYRITHDENSMLTALANSGKFDFNAPKVIAYCFPSGTGLRELDAIKMIKERHERAGRGIDFAVRFIERTDWSRFALAVANDRNLRYGFDLALEKKNGFGLSDVAVVKEDIFRKSITDILEIDAKQYLDRGHGVFLMSLNSLVGFPPHLQDKFVSETGKFCERHRDSEIKTLISLTTQRDLFSNLGVFYKLWHRVNSRKAGIPKSYFRGLPKEKETDYQIIDASHFINYTVEELLLADSKDTEFAVRQDLDEQRNQRYNIGVTVKRDIRLSDQYGNPVLADGKPVVIKRGTKIIMHRSNRFNYKRICDFTHMGNFTYIPTNTPQAALFRG